MRTIYKSKLYEEHNQGMKILMINPWIGSLADYTHGLCNGLEKNSQDVDMVTNVYDSYGDSSKYNVIPLFFRLSEKMKRGVLRKIVRTVEYIYAYVRIFQMILRNKYDIVHVQWCLFYSFDVFALKLIKRNTKNIIFTAHNVLPHIDGERYLKKLEVLYRNFDRIIVHGNSIKEEFIHYFPQYTDKVFIQYHGCRLSINKKVSAQDVPDKILDTIKDREKIYIFFGGIFYNKGIDVLMRVWRENYSNSNNLLVLAGRIIEKYDELDYELKNTNANVLILKGYLEDSLLDYLIDSSNLVMLPYRHASMSGVVFTAAQHSKTIITTNVGSIPEYLENGKDSIIINKDERQLIEAIYNVENEVSVEELNTMGRLLHENINKKYNWDTIASLLIHNVYW